MLQYMYVPADEGDLQAQLLLRLAGVHNVVVSEQDCFDYDVRIQTISGSPFFDSRITKREVASESSGPITMRLGTAAAPNRVEIWPGSRTV